MPSDRTDFLRNYYDLLTDDIRRSEATIYKVCAIESTFVLFLAIDRWYQGPIYLPAVLVLLASAWSIHMLMNANLWARRSHLMAANVELEFFNVADMDVLLPRVYYGQAQHYGYRRVFRAPLLLSTSFFAVGVFVTPLTLTVPSSLVFALSVLLVWSVFFEDRRCRREYAYLVMHAPGPRKT